MPAGELRSPMKSVALCGSSLVWPLCEHQTTVNLWGRPLRVGLVSSQAPELDQTDPKHRNKVLVQVQAFSCNYRDKALVLAFDSICRPDSFLCFGCEFVGEVLEAGGDVKGLRAGDRVIGNGSYPDSGEEGVAAGIPSNHASKRRLLVAGSRLLKVPQDMPAEVAASFQVGSQTAYSLVRRLELKEGARVLVTAARSNTSLAALHALSRLPVETYAITTSRNINLAWPDRTALIQLAAGSRLKDNPELTKLAPFDAVIDPYFDLYMHQVLPLLRQGGKYITCGCYRQAEEYGQDQAEGGRLLNIGMDAVTGNLQILGNCLGTSEDLQKALLDYREGRYAVTIDSVFRGEQVGPFVERSFNDPARFGKVAYIYTE